jgi:hypothetical protein
MRSFSGSSAHRPGVTVRTTLGNAEEGQGMSESNSTAFAAVF